MTMHGNMNVRYIKIYVYICTQIQSSISCICICVIYNILSALRTKISKLLNFNRYINTI